MPEKEGLRERKKLATREAISNVATWLFMEHGFDNVTVTQIAEAADVSKMTVFNYFPRKEDLYFDREGEAREIVSEALAQRARGESPLSAMRNLVHRLVKEQHPFTKFTAGTARFWRTVSESPALSGRAREMRDDLAKEIATLFTDSVALPHSDPEAHLFAGLLVTTLTTAYAEALRLQRKGQTNSAARQAFLDLIERGFDGIAAALKGTLYV